MEDIIKKAFYTGIGFITNDKNLKDRINDLVNEGDMTAEEGKKAFAEFVKTGSALKLLSCKNWELFI